mmetsp:Transcript_14023/g.37885  ORF Transcript_14023/g.37885 Transcript_14023/m.37885 type:complete len:262 (-) Transcript_14023:605-1390(-)
MCTWPAPCCPLPHVPPGAMAPSWSICMSEATPGAPSPLATLACRRCCRCCSCWPVRSYKRTEESAKPATSFVTLDEKVAQFKLWRALTKVKRQQEGREAGATGALLAMSVNQDCSSCVSSHCGTQGCGSTRSLVSCILFFSSAAASFRSVSGSSFFFFFFSASPSSSSASPSASLPCSCGGKGGGACDAASLSNAWSSTFPFKRPKCTGCWFVKATSASSKPIGLLKSSASASPSSGSSTTGCGGPSVTSRLMCSLMMPAS